VTARSSSSDSRIRRASDFRLRSSTHTQAQEAFLEEHVLAFVHFGAVPARIRYDNLKPAVTRVLRGRNRTESERFIALRSHYGFESFFCIPGKQGAHEKAASRARSAGSAAATWPRSRTSPRWPS
jgi:transposase